MGAYGFRSAFGRTDLKMAVYRKSLFLADLAWRDVTRLMGDARTISLSDQLYRAAGCVEANIAEGYSKSSRKDRLRFYEYALGSARETRGWYFKARHILGDQVLQHRTELLTEITKLLLKMIARDDNPRSADDAVPSSSYALRTTNYALLTCMNSQSSAQETWPRRSRAASCGAGCSGRSRSSRPTCAARRELLRRTGVHAFESGADAVRQRKPSSCCSA